MRTPFRCHRDEREQKINLAAAAVWASQRERRRHGATGRAGARRLPCPIMIMTGGAELPLLDPLTAEAPATRVATRVATLAQHHSSLATSSP